MEMRLQGIGICPAIPAGELKVGDVTVWNFGETETITEIIKETVKTILVKIECGSGYTGTRRLNKSRLVVRRKTK